MVGNLRLLCFFLERQRTLREKPGQMRPIWKE